MKNKNTKEDFIILSLIIIVLLATVGLVARSVDYAVNYEVRKVNTAWIQELDRRGLIIKNKYGSFRWKK